MEIIKTIFKLSFFILGCIMLMLALLVIPVGIRSFLWFFSFSLFFYLLSFQYVLLIFKFIINKLSGKNFKETKEEENNDEEDQIEWKNLSLQEIAYNSSLKQIKLHSKIYTYDQIEFVKLIANYQEITINELKKLENIKNLEIKIATKIKKRTIKHFKYISSKMNLKQEKKIKKEAIKDYKKLTLVVK